MDILRRFLPGKLIAVSNHKPMARLKRKSPVMEDGNTQAGSLKVIDPTMDFGNGVSLSVFNTALAAVETKLEGYNTLLTETDKALNDLQLAEKTVSDLSSRLLAGVKSKYGADSSQYEQAGGTRTSERKKPSRSTTPVTPPPPGP
jgi:hypothetical protein